jgi:hypothetical protein
LAVHKAHVIGSFLWSDFVKKCSEANAQKRVAKTCPVAMLVGRTAIAEKKHHRQN